MGALGVIQKKAANRPAGVPIAEIFWGLLTAGSLVVLLRCLAC